MTMFLFKIVLAILLSCNFSTGQLTPQERCEAKPNGITIPICNSCVEVIDCLSGTLGDSAFCGSPIPSATVIEVCDVNIAEGLCINSPSSTASPICMCQTVGCKIDPNNPELHVKCTAPGELGEIVQSCSAPDPFFDAENCECVADYPGTCPTCNTVGLGDSTVCQNSFIYCDGRNKGITITCEDNFCYNSDTCDCKEETSSGCGVTECGDDPAGNDLYCACESDTWVCGKSCPSGETFDTDNCACVSDRTNPSEQCSTCGFIDDPDGSCARYYQCDQTGEITTGPYDCPGLTCFDESACNCIAP